MKKTWANSLVVRLRIRTLFELIASTLPGFLWQIRNMNTVWLQKTESRNLEFGAGVKDDRGALGNCSIAEVNTYAHHVWEQPPGVYHSLTKTLELWCTKPPSSIHTRMGWKL